MRWVRWSLVLGVTWGILGVASAAEPAKEGEAKKAGRGKAAAKNRFPKKDGWIRLFDGKSLTGWHARNPNAKMTWKAEKGVLVNDVPAGQHGVDLVTDQKFEDFELHIEFKVEKGQNSGVYLRGRYEVQVLESHGRQPTMETCGSIYSQKVASKDATKPAGQWQAFDVTLEGKTVTVRLNGEVIIDKHVLTAPTGGALDDKVNEPGPLMLQGDHTAVAYRNIHIKPLKK